MSIVRRELPQGSQWKWKWIWRRQIGNYLVVCEWVKWLYVDKGGLDYIIEWQDRNGQALHTEFCQRTPEW